MSTNGVAQVLLVSKAHMQSVKQLYKMIFRLHKSLPPDMKELGDKYVRNEFKLHKTASPEHTKVFLNEWANYTRLLMRQANPRMGEKFGANLDLKQFDDFKDEQITQLYELFVEIKGFDPTKKNPPKQPIIISPMSLFLSSTKSSKLVVKNAQLVLNKQKTVIRKSSSLQSPENDRNTDEAGIEPLLFKIDDVCERLTSTSTNEPFKFGEFINCRLIVSRLNSNSKTPPTVSNRLIRLEHGRVFKTRRFDVFHEHICRLRSFTFKNLRFDFKRPSLYEYISLKEQQAVSSHFSIISLVPLLLEIEKGSRVLECGTGAGSMTLFLSERLGDTGLLHTFELDSKRQQVAARKFSEWKSSYDLRSPTDKWPSNVRFGCVDFNSTSNHLPEKLPGFYDAVYLDMANLHEAVLKAYELLRPGGVVVINSMHLTQILRCLAEIQKRGLATRLEKEIIIEPAHRFWETRKIHGDDEFSWTLRLEDRFDEKYKRGGLFFNYWQGFLAKFRKIKQCVQDERFN